MHVLPVTTSVGSGFLPPRPRARAAVCCRGGGARNNAMHPEDPGCRTPMPRLACGHQCGRRGSARAGGTRVAGPELSPGSRRGSDRAAGAWRECADRDDTPCNVARWWGPARRRWCWVVELAAAAWREVTARDDTPCNVARWWGPARCRWRRVVELAAAAWREGADRDDTPCNVARWWGPARRRWCRVVELAAAAWREVTARDDTPCNVARWWCAVCAGGAGWPDRWAGLALAPHLPTLALLFAAQALNGRIAQRSLAPRGSGLSSRCRRSDAEGDVVGGGDRRGGSSVRAWPRATSGALRPRGECAQRSHAPRGSGLPSRCRRSDAEGDVVGGGDRRGGSSVRAWPGATSGGLRPRGECAQRSLAPRGSGLPSRCRHGCPRRWCDARRRLGGEECAERPRPMERETRWRGLVGAWARSTRSIRFPAQARASGRENVTLPGSADCPALRPPAPCSRHPPALRTPRKQEQRPWRRRFAR